MASFEKQESSFAPRKTGLSRSERRQSDSYSSNDPYALAAHGLVRSTGEIDLWVRPTAENASRVMQALRQFRAPLGDLTEADLHTPDIVFQIGLPPRRIDLLTSIANVEFCEAWTDRRLTTVSGIHFPVLGRAMFLKNKRSTGRAKDLADAEWLEENPESPIGGEAQTRR